MPSIPFTIRQLEYFDATASEGSLAAAAQRCNVSASALALALDELESRLALQLFVGLWTILLSGDLLDKPRAPVHATDIGGGIGIHTEPPSSHSTR